jgi:hypothetical protein
MFNQSKKLCYRIVVDAKKSIATQILSLLLRTACHARKSNRHHLYKPHLEDILSTILTNRIKNHIDSALRDAMYLEDCQEDAANIYSRGLVGICLAGLSGQSYATVVDYITDGTKDNGIDGVYYDAGRNKIYIIQAKWSTKGTGTIDTGDLRKFLAGAYDLLNEEWSKFNKRFQAIAPTISTGIRKDPEIVLVAAFNSDNPVSDDCQRIVQNFLDENNSDSQEVVSFKTFDLKHLIRTMKVVKSGAKSDIEVNLLQWGEQKEPYYAIYGKVSCADVAEWYKLHDELLFSENIRGTLAESEINSQIEAELQTNPTDFWYLNNGITAIAEEVKRKPIGLGDQRESSYWNASNIKIVNGAQTTGSIAKVYAKNPKAVRKAYVQIKIISLDSAPIDIANRITTATNTQNKVEPKDFLALDANQDGIAESFKRLGIQYCFRRGEKVMDNLNGLDVQELAMTLAVTGTNIANVVVAKRNAGSLTDPNGYYQKIFDQPIVAKEAWEAVKRWRAANEAVAHFAATVSGREAQLAVHGNRFLEHLLTQNNVKTIDTATINTYHKALKSAVDSLYSDCYLAVLFKNAKKCEALRNRVRLTISGSTTKKRLVNTTKK